MAGRGPAPKDPSKRVRKSRNMGEFQVIEIEPHRQPALVEVLGEINPATSEPWSKPSLDLWEALGGFPTTQSLTATQWQLLARAIILDDLIMRGEVKHMQEFRLQLAKFFIAPDDVLRGRFQFAQADEAENRMQQRRSSLGGSARARRGPLTAES